MIHRVYLSWGFAQLDPTTVDRLDRIANSRVKQEYSCTLWTLSDDPVIDQIEIVLRQKGVPSFDDTYDLNNPYFTLSRTRIWEQSDLDIAEYFLFNINSWSKLPHLVGFVEYENSRLLCVEAKDLPKRTSFVGNKPAILCSDSVKDRLFGQQFAHLGFARVKVKRRIEGPPFFEDVPDHPRWWQITSDLVLPPMSPAIRRGDPATGAEIVSREHQGAVRLTEPPFKDFQPRYVRSEWRGVPAFDVAGTYELYMSGVYGRMLIVSRRFYEFCQREGLKADWVPVRFEN